MRHSSVPCYTVSQSDWYLMAGTHDKTTGRGTTSQPMLTRQADAVFPGKKLIWLADDDADDRELFAEAIGWMNPPVKLHMLENGRTLMQQLYTTATLPDLLFLDLNMPGKNGRECLQEIRRSEKLSHIPVIIYSTSSAPKDIEDTFEKGANLYVRKPNSFKDLILLSEKIMMLDWEQYQPGSSRTKYVFTLK